MTPSWIRTLFATYKRISTDKLKPEDTFSVEFTSILVPLTIQQRLNCVWFHVPNESGRNTIYYGTIQKAKGVVAGVSDYIFISKDIQVAIELKCGKNKPSDKQTAFADWCAASGFKCYVVYSIQEALEALHICGLLHLENYHHALQLSEKV